MPCAYTGAALCRQAGPGHREQARHQRLPLQPPGYGFRRLQKILPFVIQDSLKKKLRVKMNKGRRYRFMYNEILAKRRVFKDFQIKRVFEDKELGHRKS